MKYKIFALFVIATLFLSACGASPAGGGGGTQQSIKIGGGFALTGDESSLDLPAANGAKLAVKDKKNRPVYGYTTTAWAPFVPLIVTFIGFHFL